MNVPNDNIDSLSEQVTALAQRLSDLAANDPTLSDDQRLGYLNKADSLLIQAAAEETKRALASLQQLQPLIGQLAEQTKALKEKIQTLKDFDQLLDVVAVALELFTAASTGDVGAAAGAVGKMLALAKTDEADQA